MLEKFLPELRWVNYRAVTKVYFFHRFIRPDLKSGEHGGQMNLCTDTEPCQNVGSFNFAYVFHWSATGSYCSIVSVRPDSEAYPPLIVTFPIWINKLYIFLKHSKQIFYLFVEIKLNTDHLKQSMNHPNAPPLTRPVTSTSFQSDQKPAYVSNRRPGNRVSRSLRSSRGTRTRVQLAPAHFASIHRSMGQTQTTKSDRVHCRPGVRRQYTEFPLIKY